MKRSAILSELKRLADPDKRKVLMGFFKTGKGQYGEGDRFLGVPVPKIRSVVKARWNACSTAEAETLFASPYHEARLAALFVLLHRYEAANGNDALQRKIVGEYLDHIDRINNWDLVDLTCHKILGDWFLTRSRQPLYDMARNGRTIWEQRIAMVTTLAFIRVGEFNDTFAIADILLNHPHDLIHKAVGWMLREVGKRDRNALESYLAPRHAQMPRTMLRYAIEKFPEPLRQKWLRRKLGEKVERVELVE